MLACCALLALQEVAETGALSPAAELAAFTVAPGFVVELVAAEPDTPKVVDVAFDDAGRMWAVTAVEYPVDGNETPDALELYRGGGRDRVLVFDTPTAPGRQTPRVFADGLALPLAILPYRDGALVGHGPDVLFLRDTDGDGRADAREVVLTGFGIQDSHLLPHRFTRGPGGWVYVAQGAFNESDVVARDGSVTEFDQCKVGRFKPDGSRFELVGVGLNNIWGFVIDRRGDFFVQEANDLGYPVAPFPLGASYPGIGSHRFRPYSPWQPPPADFRVGGTGLSGLALSEDPGGFPDDWDGVFFVANPVVNAIQSIRLHSHGGGGGGGGGGGDVPRLERVDDLLTSSDPWFRPIAIHFGPDGFLYVVDWYNKVLSHNEVPRDHPDRDKTRGRIWRVRPAGAPRPQIPDLTALSDRDVALRLAADSTWEARAAWHQLVEREALELAPALELFAFDDELPVAPRLLALWTLEELGRARGELLAELVVDDDPAVRREAVRVLGNLGLSARDLVEELSAPVPWTDAGVRLARVRALDALPDPGEVGVAALVAAVRPAIDGPRVRLQDRNEEVLAGAAADRALERSLIRKALEEHPDAVLAHLDAGDAAPGEGRALALLAVGGEEGATRLADLLPELSREPSREELVLLAGHAAAPRVRAALGAMLHDEERSGTALALLLEAGDRVELGELAAPVAAAARRHPAELVRTATVFRLRELEPDVVALLRDGEPSRAEQLAALRALVEMGCEEVGLFADLARASLPDEALRREAAAALAGARSPDAGPLFVELWPDLTPPTRRLAVARATEHREGAARLVAAVAAGDVEPRAIDTRALERMETLLAGEPEVVALRAALSSGGTRVLALGGHTDDYVDTDVALAGAFTVEAWVRLEGDVTNADGLLGVPGGADFNFHDRRFRVYAGAGRGDVIVAEKRIEPGRWMHVAVTRDGAGAFRMYVDGELDTDRCTPTQETFADLDACRTIPSRGTLGQVAELRIWSAARTAEQIGAWFRRALADGEEPAGLLLRLPDDGAALHGGARFEHTLDAPPILTAGEARAEEERFARYRALAASGGDPTRGRELFGESCLACHRVGGQGVAIGPVLDGAGAMGVEALLRSILTPNAAVETGYRTLVVRTHDGELLEGFLVSRDDASLLLRRRDREDLRIPRTDVANSYFDSLSLMPEGLLDALEPAQVVDLFAYLGTLR